MHDNQLDKQIIKDLQKLEAVLNIGTHYLFELAPISSPCIHEHQEQPCRFQGRGAFTISHRYFDSINDFLRSLLGGSIGEESVENNNNTATNDSEVTTLQ